MTSKEQERAALVKIKEIVADLGKDSYLGSAFDGAFQLAENNIEDDAAYSARYYIDRCNALESGNYAEKAEAQNEITRLKQEIEILHRTEQYLQGKVNEIEALNAKLKHDHSESERGLEECKNGLKIKDMEIMGLKAKLYDAMVSGL